MSDELWTLTFRVLPGEEKPEQRIRRMLKTALRRDGLRCVRQGTPGLRSSPLTLKEQSMNVQPNVGRHVWFYPVGCNPKMEQPLAAIITYVWSDTLVNLAIFDHNGRLWAGPTTRILLVQPDMTAPAEGSFCVWMSYQVETARRLQQAPDQRSKEEV